MTELVRWNPTRPTGFSRRLPRRLSARFERPVDNFGDLLGPLIVRRLLRVRGLRNPSSSARLLTVGSVLGQARDGDTVWGSGRNGKVPDHWHRFRSLDVRAVRGPRTAAWLASRGIDPPEVFGDPAMLLPGLFPELAVDERDRSDEVVFVPNLNDVGRLEVPGGVRVISPQGDPMRIVGQLLRSRLVVASSLHAVIVAEAFGVPARLVHSMVEPDFKYLDHLEATGRTGAVISPTVAEAIAVGGQEPPVWDPAPLLDAFPEDLFEKA